MNLKQITKHVSIDQDHPHNHKIVHVNSSPFFLSHVKLAFSVSTFVFCEANESKEWRNTIAQLEASGVYINADSAKKCAEYALDALMRLV